MRFRDVGSVWYRGSDSSSVGLKVDGNVSEQFGPGVYFTDDPRIAGDYGRVREYSIDISKGFCFKGDKIDRVKIKELIGFADGEHLGLALSNWDENPKVAMRRLFDSIMKCKDMPDAVTQVALDVFNWDRDDFLMSARACGINGIVIDDPFDSGRSSRFLVLYNFKLAKLVSDEVVEYD